MHASSVAPLRVLVAIPNLSGGGAERMALQLCDRLAKRGVDVTLLVHENTGSLNHLLAPSLKIVFCGDKPYRRRHLPRLLRQTIEHARHADVLLAANEGRAGFLLTLASLVTKRPVVAWIHVDWRYFAAQSSWRTRAAMRLYGLAKAIVCVSQGALEGLNSVVAFSNQRTRVIYNGIDVAGVAQLASKPVAAEHAAWFERPTLVAVGRLDEQKDFASLISAHALLRRQGLDVNLVILGEGGLLDALRAQTRELGTEAHVHFPGFLENPYSYMRRATVFALSSRFEGFGIVLAEAMACEAVIVSVDCPSGPREVLGDGVAGLLVPPGSVESLATALGNALTDVPLRARLRQGSVLQARMFSLDACTTEWTALLHQVAGRDTPQPLEQETLPSSRPLAARAESVFPPN